MHPSSLKTLSDGRDRVFAQIERGAGRTVALLQRLVRIPTVNPPGCRYAACTELLAAELRRLGLEVRRLRAGGADAEYPRFNVVGFRDAGAAATLHFNCHYDVVPASPEGWRFPPFEPRVEGGRIYGRGTGDMKGAIAAVCAALAGLRGARVAPRCNIEVSFTADEETDSALGADWLAASGRLRATHVVVGEAGSGPAVCCGHNGCLWFEVKVRGRPAHGSNPSAGINAFEKMAALVVELEGYKRRLARRTFIGPDGRAMHPTANLGGVFGSGEGGKVNTVPGAAGFTVDRRLVPGEDPEAAEEEFRAAVEAAARRIPQLEAKVERFTFSPALFTPPLNPLFRAMAASVRRVRGGRVRPSVSTGFNDMHFFARHLGVPVVGYGPLGFRYHGADECAPVRDLTTTAKVYADLMLSFGG